MNPAFAVIFEIVTNLPSYRILGGLEVMLQRLAAIQRVGGARALCSTLLRLLGLCARVRRCVRVLTRADTRALPVLLRALQLAADEEKDMPRAHLVYQLLEVCTRTSAYKM